MPTSIKEPVTGRSRQWPPPQVLLLLTFAAFYFAIGPGNFFAVDEVSVEETAQSLILRGTLDIPVMADADSGRGDSYYTVKGAGLPFMALPFVYTGLLLDDAQGSMNGGVIAGAPMGWPEHPLRWSGRLALTAALTLNALAGGAVVAMLFMVGMRLTGNARAALLMAAATGLGTLLMSEATHFYQHPISALMLIVAFWFFADERPHRHERSALLGGLALGVAMLTRANTTPVAVVLWLYGVAVGWRMMRTGPDAWANLIRRSAQAAAGPVASVVGILYYNYLRFGAITQLGYVKDKDQFVISAIQIAKTIGGYTVSPALSVFLFAPPLILVVAGARQAYRRWPLETAVLAAAAMVHLTLLTAFRSWNGDLSYGPRLMLEPIVLLMPLSLPVFEQVVLMSPRRIVIAIAAIVAVGFGVQLIGVSVYVTVNEWRRIAAGVVDNGDWVFVPAMSPIVIDLKEIWAGQNLSPWAIRAFANPGRALLLLIALIAIVRVGRWRLWQFYREPAEEHARLLSDGLPTAIVLAAVVPIVIGFAVVSPLTDPRGKHAFDVFEAGLAAQKAGYAVTAQEDYALVLGIDPANKYALYDLGVLQEDAGRTAEASVLYMRTLALDPHFTLAERHLALLRARGLK